MSSLSPKPRAALLPLARTALQARARCTNAKNLGTHESRLRFYKTKFASTYNLAANPLLLNVTQADRNVIMACFASFLLMGHTLLCKSINVDTVKKYLLAIKDYFVDHNQWYPSIVKHDITAPVLTSVYKEGQRWESMPNRQEPITMEIMRFLISQASTSHQDSPEAAIADWCIIGSQSGFRCSEWCQSHFSKSLPLSSEANKSID